MKFNKILKLNAELNLINAKYDSIAKATGSDYNIFQVLRIETKEVTTHSRMISDLLNPRGSHGMGSKFLSLFFESIEIEIPRNIESVVCITEKNYGSIDQHEIKGGNIDIILEGLDKPIIIENKIFAKDQENQLLRYYNLFDGNCEIYYLTLFGNKPSGYSKGHQNFITKTISYSHNILEWLEKCYQLTINRPLLRETLKQYINVVKILTGQSMDDNKSKEIFDFIEENKDIMANIHTHLNSFVDNRLNKLIKEIVNEINKNDKILNSLVERPFLSQHEGGLFCHFKIGNQNEKGVIFELSIRTKKLSLWTTAWRWDGKDTYGTDMELINSLKQVDCYEKPLDASKPLEELVQKVTNGIHASVDYYERIKV